MISEYQTNETLSAWGEYCRVNKIKIIIASVQGTFGRIFNDWGEEFTVLDKNGEEVPEVMIKSITNEEKAKVELLSKHLFEDGDMVLISNVEGMQFNSDSSKSIN